MKIVALVFRAEYLDFGVEVASVCDDGGGDGDLGCEQKGCRLKTEYC